MTEHRVVRLAFYSLVMVLGISLSAARFVEADEIVFAPVPPGSSTAGHVFDLTVSFDPNCVRDLETGACVTGSVTNLVGQELYVDFFGLAPVDGSYALGSVYALLDLSPDPLTGNGLCTDTLVFCSSSAPSSGMAARYQSRVNVYWPSVATVPTVPSGPDTLLSLRFTSIADTWGLNVVGDTDFSLLWDPGSLCDADNCALPPSFPFVIVSADDKRSYPGTARVNVSLTEVPTGPVTPVPEPSSLVLAATGLIGIARSLRRRSGSGRRPIDRG